MSNQMQPVQWLRKPRKKYTTSKAAAAAMRAELIGDAEHPYPQRALELLEEWWDVLQERAR